jgi:hypothetical protein
MCILVQIFNVFFKLKSAFVGVGKVLKIYENEVAIFIFKILQKYMQKPLFLS